MKVELEDVFSEEIESFKKERNTVLLSLDKEKIKNFMRKNKAPIPRKEVFWISVHKAITGCVSLPLKFRNESKQWLNDRSYYSLDDGELK